jgi:hypothetical protein
MVPFTHLLQIYTGIISISKSPREILSHLANRVIKIHVKHERNYTSPS